MTQQALIGRFRVSAEGEIVSMDDTAARIAGSPHDAALPPPNAEPLNNVRAHVRAAGRRAGAISFEREWRGPSGEPKCARVMLVPAPGASGEIEHFDGIIETLQPGLCGDPASAIGFVESLIEGLPNPVFVKDERHRWVLLNAACCRFMGAERSDLLGQSDFDFFPPEEARVFWEKDDEVFASGGVNENEEQFTDSAGRTHVILTRKTLIRDQNGRRFLLGVISDVTALREAVNQLRATQELLEERVRQRTQALSDANARLREQDANRAAFLNVLGHELRNPLSAVLMSTYVMKRVPAGSSDALHAREVVERQVQHLTRLCDDLLDVARVAHRKLQLHARTLDLVPVVRTICEDQRALFEARELALVFEAREVGAMWVKADGTRLNQVVGNLLHNALKFTPPGGRVHVNVRRGAAGAEVLVRDSGVGAAPEDLERMFEPFVQARGSSPRGQGGLGLGLALAKGLVEAHGGVVTARSEGPGRGLEITVSLPLSQEPADAAESVSASTVARSLTVVVIDDDRDVRETLVELLRLEGHRAHAAPDGRSGLVLAKSVRPDAVVCDLELPDLDGYAVARTLRADEDLESCSLIALSGFADPEIVERARAAGFDFHLAKPPSLEQLSSLLSVAVLPGEG